MDPNDTCGSDVVQEALSVIESQVSDSLRLYRVAQDDIDATLRCGMLPTVTQQRARYTALQSYHSCLRALQVVSSGAGGSTGSTASAIDTPDDEAYRLLSDETLARIASELESATNDAK